MPQILLGVVLARPLRELPEGHVDAAHVRRLAMAGDGHAVVRGARACPRALRGRRVGARQVVRAAAGLVDDDGGDDDAHAQLVLEDGICPRHGLRRGENRGGPPASHGDEAVVENEPHRDLVQPRCRAVGEPAVRPRGAVERLRGVGSAKLATSRRLAGLDDGDRVRSMGITLTAFTHARKGCKRHGRTAERDRLSCDVEDFARAVDGQIDLAALARARESGACPAVRKDALVDIE